MVSPVGKSVVVFGGTGLYGQQVVKCLVSMKIPVRVVSRNGSRARQILGEQVEIVEGDVTHRDTIVRGVQDTRAIVIALSAASPGLIRQRKAIEYDAVMAIIEEARANGVDRLVYFSGYELRIDFLKKLKIIDFGRYMIDAENRIRQSEFNWTILGCAPSTDLFFTLLWGNKLPIPGGGKRPFPTISATDVGEIAAQTVVRENLNGQRLRLTGPEAITFPRMADKITRMTGKPVHALTIPLGAVRVGTFLIKPLFPYPRYIYKSLKMLNNFPSDLVDQVPDDHQKLRELFEYQPVTLEDEIISRCAD